MNRYSVQTLSQLAGVSIKTLHHYDKINLLPPAGRSEKGYRFYTRKELLLLQQILFYRELGLPLRQIRDLLSAPDFDLLRALEAHKVALRKHQKRLKTLIQTLDNTISELQNNTMNITEENMYAGFRPEEVPSIRSEVSERWGMEMLLETEARLQKLSKTDWENLQQKGEAINALLGSLVNLPPTAPQVQQAVGLHFDYLSHYRELNLASYKQLGDLYVEDPRFSAYYARYAASLPTFLQAAIQAYCSTATQAD